MPNFAILGASGFVAPRHLRAIREAGGRLVAATDPADPPADTRALLGEACLFSEGARFWEHLESLRGGDRADFVSICSPNDLHEVQIRRALAVGATVVCEKPLVLDPRALDGLEVAERAAERRVFTVLQLRLHPRILAARERLPARPPPGGHEVSLSFVTRRGPAYFASWKGIEARSGGLAMNIGVHYFDLLLWLFGAARGAAVLRRESGALEGTLDLERARVRWLLSVDEARPPPGSAGVHRSLSVDGEQVDFTGGTEDLHASVYREILAGRGTGIAEARPSVELVDRIRRTVSKG